MRPSALSRMIFPFKLGTVIRHHHFRLVSTFTRTSELTEQSRIHWNPDGAAAPPSQSAVRDGCPAGEASLDRSRRGGPMCLGASDPANQRPGIGERAPAPRPLTGLGHDAMHATLRYNPSLPPSPDSTHTDPTDPTRPPLLGRVHFSHSDLDGSATWWQGDIYNEQAVQSIHYICPLVTRWRCSREKWTRPGRGRTP